MWLTKRWGQQGYEVTEEEVQIPLDEFKGKYSDPLGYPEYAMRFFPPFFLLKRKVVF